MKLAVFGDIGGHAELFEQALISVGCDPSTGYVPDGLYVIQVGDLVDRGPDSEGAFRIALNMMTGSCSDQYIQLIGNHEAQYLGGPKFETPHSASELLGPNIKILKELRKEGRIKIAVGAITEDGKPYLITHAGLGPAFWGLYLARHEHLDKLVPALNSMGHKVFDAGWLLGSRDIPGPCWAMTWDEVIAAWLQQDIFDMPWNQVHGHHNLYKWDRQKATVHPLFVGELEVWPDRRISRFPVHGRYVYQIDHSHKTESSHQAQPQH